ncbi:hypothetical protein EDE05_1063 [Neorhizobium sp. R1-B]|nr:hypothetical protein EDE05_1063 [Neorhizobium sp. R1-B]
MEFLDTVIEHLTEKGVMDPGLLDGSSFVDMAPKDPQQVFDFEKTKRVIRGLNGGAAQRVKEQGQMFPDLILKSERLMLIRPGACRGTTSRDEPIRPLCRG